MSLTATTHLNFRGQARSALELYKSVFGGELVIVTFADAHAAANPAEANQVMWGQVEAPDGVRLMAFDVPSARAIWNKLVVDAKVQQPLGPAAWAPLYGMLTDRFGITWVMDAQA